MMATLLPVGSGWVESNNAASKASESVSTRITPDWENSVATEVSDTGELDRAKPGATNA